MQHYYTGQALWFLTFLCTTTPVTLWRLAAFGDFQKKNA